MLPSHSLLDRSDRPAGAAPSRPKIVKLVLNSLDLDEPITLTMYNVVREGLAAAAKVIAKGGSVGLELQDGADAAVRHRLLTTEADLDEWRDAVNRLTVLCHPTPRIPGR